jgi:hypothetical protein
MRGLGWVGIGLSLIVNGAKGEEMKFFIEKNVLGVGGSNQSLTAWLSVARYVLFPLVKILFNLNAPLPLKVVYIWRLFSSGYRIDYKSRGNFSESSGRKREI